MHLDPVLAIGLSLKVAFFSTIISLPFAIFFAWMLARVNFSGKFLLSSFLFIPLVLPPIVTGFFLLDVFGKNSFWGSLLAQMGLPITFNLFGAILASMIVGFPLYVMMIRNSFESMDERFEEMAMTLGFSPLKTFFHFTLPMCLPGIIAGSILSFARSLGEFGATIMVAGNMEGVTRTIPLAVYSLLDAPNGEQESWFLIKISIGLCLVSLITFEVLNRLHKKRLGHKT